jgi:hypothetical protein
MASGTACQGGRCRRSISALKWSDGMTRQAYTMVYDGPLDRRAQMIVNHGCLPKA